MLTSNHDQNLSHPTLAAGPDSAAAVNVDTTLTMDPAPLTKSQLHALFNILTHAETYSEIEAFKHPDAVHHYGYPFAPPPAGGSDDGKTPDADVTSPLLQTLLVKLVLPIPGIRDLPPDFWNVRVQGILAKLAEEDLSESYDKGAIGTRKTLATGASALIEMFARGCLGGYPKDEAVNHMNGNGNGEKKGKSLEDSWEEFIQGLVHGELIDELQQWLTRTEDLEGYSELVEAAADYAIIK